MGLLKRRNPVGRKEESKGRREGREGNLRKECKDALSSQFTREEM